MDRAEVMDRVVKILTPWVKDEAALAKVSMDTNILEDLKVNKRAAGRHKDLADLDNLP